MSTTKQIKYQVKFLNSSNIVSYKQAVLDFFNELEYDKFDKHVDFSEVQTSFTELDYDELKKISIVITCSNIKTDHDFVDFVTHINRNWCIKAEKSIFLEWLIPDISYIHSPTFITTGSLRPVEIAFGTLPLMKDYAQMHLFREIPNISSILCNFNHLQKEVVIFMSSTHRIGCPNISGGNLEMGGKIVFSYDSIIRIIADVGPGTNNAGIFLHLEYPPFMYVKAKRQSEPENAENQIPSRVVKVKEMEYSLKKFERAFELFCSCNCSLLHCWKIGKNLVLKLTVTDKFQFRWNLEQLSLRCSKKTEICFTKVKTHIFRKARVRFRFYPLNFYKDRKFNDIEKYNYNYAWNVITSRSDVMAHQMDLKDNTQTYRYEIQDWIVFLADTNISALVKSLYSIGDLIDRGIPFSFEYALKKYFLYFSNFVELNKLPNGICHVRRIILTPSRTIYLQPYENFENRIVREFGAEYMMRLSVQDDNFSKLTFAVQYNSKKETIMKNIVASPLLNGITIGTRKYEVLAASNSQLREHGMWLYAKDECGNTASDIRNWMGNFSCIKNVAKHMARMGQCLSSIEAGIHILIKDEDELAVHDIKSKDGRYTFSDGIGIVSTELADEVSIIHFSIFLTYVVQYLIYHIAISLLKMQHDTKYFTEIEFHKLLDYYFYIESLHN